MTTKKRADAAPHILVHCRTAGCRNRTPSRSGLCSECVAAKFRARAENQTPTPKATEGLGEIVRAHIA